MTMGRGREEEGLVLSGGRFVPRVNRILPPTREVRIESYGLQAEPGVDMPYHFGEIAGLISGLPTGSILDAWVEYLPAVGGSYTRAAAIPVGSQCKFRASVSANSGGGTAWAIVATVIDLYDGALKDYHLATSNFSVDIAFNDYLQNRHNTPWVMPNHDLNLSFRLFASFDASPDHTLLDNGDASMYY